MSKTKTQAPKRRCSTHRSSRAIAKAECMDSMPGEMKLCRPRSVKPAPILVIRMCTGNREIEKKKFNGVEVRIWPSSSAGARPKFFCRILPILAFGEEVSPSHWAHDGRISTSWR